MDPERRNRALKLDILGAMAYGSVLQVGLMVPFAAIIIVFTELDPFFYILEEIFSPYYRSLWVIIADPLGRIVLVYFILSELVRTAYIGLVVLIGSIFLVISIERCLLRIGRLDCLNFYIRFNF